jgi:hypothetical protein
MSILFEERPSDSPYIETITHGHTACDGMVTRPAESHWHLVVVHQRGHVHTVLVGPWTTAGVVRYTADAEVLWIKLKLGTFLPNLPVRSLLDTETILPGAARHAPRWLAHPDCRGGAAIRTLPSHPYATGAAAGQHTPNLVHASRQRRRPRLRTPSVAPGAASRTACARAGASC